MKQTIIHDRVSIPQKMRSQFRNSIEYHRDKQQNLIRHKRYKMNSGSSKHKSIYSLALESNILINDIDFNPPKPPQTLSHNSDSNQPKAILYNEHRSRQNSSICISKDIKLQRYSRNQSSIQRKAQSHMEDEFQNQRHNRQKITLLKRIIQHYNIKSFECNYYSNLMNNLGIKVSAGSQLKTRFSNTKSNNGKFQKEQTRPIKHDRSYKAKHHYSANTYDCDDFFSNNLMKVQAQSINHLLKNDSQQRPILKQELNEKQSKVKTSNNLRKTNNSMLKGSKKEMFRNENATTLKFYDYGQNCINLKVNKYKQFIYIINFTHNVYRDLDIDKYEVPFKVYIGFGNNSNLIKAIIKRRFWFEPTKSKDEAHFVWTQLKDQTIFTKQIEKQDERYQIYEKERVKLKIVKVQPQEKTASTYALQNSQEYCQNSQGKTKTDSLSKQQARSLKANSKSTQAFNPYFRVLTSQQGNAYMQMMSELSYNRRRSKFKERMKYTKHLKYVSEQQFTYEIMHNHLPLNGLLGNKKAMFYIMKEYCTRTGKNIFEVVPLTFHIKKGLADQQFKEFMVRFNQNKTNKRPNYWIMKPGQFSNRGQGITCTSKAEEVRSKINSLRKLGKNKSLIVQQYITNPLLYYGRKFDIRTYMLVCINNGKLRAYWYQDGYIRTSSYIWKLDQLEDSLVHLTNDAIQKHSHDYGRYEPANKLTYSELQRYLDTFTKTLKIKYNFLNDIYPRLKEIATDAVKASFQFVQSQRRTSNFQIFGFDFMIDSNFKPWLIEINTNPCLEVNCLVLQRIIPSMIENAFRIAVDPIFPPPLNYSSTYKYNIPENALHYNRFELIFDEERDGPGLVELYRESRVLESIEDYEQQKEVYEQEGEQINLEDN